MPSDMIYYSSQEDLLETPLLQQATLIIERISSTPLLVVLTILSILFPVLIFPLHGIGEIRLLDLHFSYNPDQVYEHLSILGAKGRSAYSRMALTSDLLFPVSYSLALSIALMLVLRKLCRPVNRFRYLCLFPFLIVIVDWCENLSLAFVTHTFPDRVDTIINFASVSSSLKWTLVILTTLMLVLGVIIWTISSIRDR